MEDEVREGTEGAPPVEVGQPVLPSGALVRATTPVPAQLVAVVSGWKIGVAAGISFALTISLIAGIVWVLRNGSDWMSASAQQQADAQRAADGPKVRPEFQAEVRAIADVMERESAILDQSPPEVQKQEKELEDRLSTLFNNAQTTHESEISYDLQDKHMGVSDCLSDIIFSKPNTPVSSCKEQLASKAEIESAVNTPYTK